MMFQTDSFSHYTDPTQKFDSVTGASITIDPTAGPRGGGALKVNGSNGAGTAIRAYPTNLTTVIHQFRFKRTGGAGCTLFQSIDSDGFTRIQIKLLTSDFLQYAINGVGNIVDSSAPSIGNVWNYIKIKITCGDPTGLVQVYLNGVEVINSTHRTQYSTDPFVQAYYFGSDSGGFVCYIADSIVMDTFGSRNNDFIGQQAVDSIFPIANGSVINFTPLSGSNYANVNENPPDSDTSYVSSSTPNDVDLYKYPDIPTGITIVAVAQNLFVKEMSAGPNGIAGQFRSNSVDQVATAIAAPDNYHFLQFISEISPATSAPWTPLEFNATLPTRAQFGEKIITL